MIAPVELSWPVGPVVMNGIEADSIELEGASPTLDYQPAQGTGPHELSEFLAVSFLLDLGHVGQSTVAVQIPIPVLREAYHAALAPTLMDGELVGHVPTGQLVRVVDGADRYGGVVVQTNDGRTRVAAQDLHRLRTWAPGHEPEATS